MAARKLVVALALLVLAAKSYGIASSATLSVSPTNPTPTDSIKITSSSFDYVGCWYMVSTSCGALVGDTLATSTDVNWCNGQPDCTCSDLLYRYDRTCSFGPLPAGAYVAKFTEVHVNSSDPEPTVVLTRTFAVGAPTPTLRRTWGALKSGYR